MHLLTFLQSSSGRRYSLVRSVTSAGLCWSLRASIGERVERWCWGSWIEARDRSANAVERSSSTFGGCGVEGPACFLRGLTRRGDVQFEVAPGFRKADRRASEARAPLSSCPFVVSLSGWSKKLTEICFRLCSPFSPVNRALWDLSVSGTFRFFGGAVSGEGLSKNALLAVASSLFLRP
jgi:hypothetical protein